MIRWLGLIALAPLLLAAKPDAASDPAQATMHTVKAGETLAGIAARAVVPRVLIIEANGLKPPYKVRPGQKLVIPRRRAYEVQPGDTGFSIALDQGMSWKEIATANGIDPKAAIKPGQKLVIPTISPAEVQSAETSTPPTKTADTGADSGAQRFAWPASGPVRRGFSAPGAKSGHPAIDIAGAAGSPVRAAAKGRIAFAGDEAKKFGNLVVIDHGGGWFTAYAKLQKVTVKKGERVKTGERIGLLGNTGETDKTELHFEVRQNNVPLDPEDLLPARD